jgi:hypothetical protein
VVRFGRARGEEQLARLAAQEARDGGARGFERAAAALAGAMGARGIHPALVERAAERVRDFRQQRRRCVVVEVEIAGLEHRLPILRRLGVAAPALRSRGRFLGFLRSEAATNATC